MAAGFLYQPILLVADVSYSLPADGLRVYYEDGVKPISVQVGDDFAELSVGQGIKASKRFDRVIIKSATTQTIKLYISDLGLIDNRVNFASSSISASIGNDTLNPLVKTLVGSFEVDEGTIDLARTLSFVNTEVDDVYITSLQVMVAVHSGGAAAPNLNWILIAVDDADAAGMLVAPIGNTGLFDKSDFLVARVGVFSLGGTPAIPPNHIVVLSRDFDNSVKIFSADAPLRLKSGQGVMLLNASGGGLSLLLEAKPSAAAQNAVIVYADDELQITSGIVGVFAGYSVTPFIFFGSVDDNQLPNSPPQQDPNLVDFFVDGSGDLVITLDPLNSLDGVWERVELDFDGAVINRSEFQFDIVGDTKYVWRYANYENGFLPAQSALRNSGMVGLIRFKYANG